VLSHKDHPFRQISSPLQASHCIVHPTTRARASVRAHEQDTRQVAVTLTTERKVAGQPALHHALWLTILPAIRVTSMARR
jgi:hypothetical protein